ncbi:MULTISPECIES: hypothetical protein [Sorangium]|uniref:hypothetical protein n=1 Tax=Sorangium TaxID=39643 RepID=UPI003D9C6074
MKRTLLPSLLVGLSAASGLIAWGCIEVGHPIEVGCVEYDTPNCREPGGATTSSRASGSTSTGGDGNAAGPDAGGAGGDGGDGGAGGHVGDSGDGGAGGHVGDSGDGGHNGDGGDGGTRM